ncbi:unnamed protein product [Dovyalis caffra]|uniref:SEC63 domain-containing protein n=1 Tax=Dovyalis caffra TaxID=77055 RepID=A0AAV1RT86_9ROSI|nr:unnamed protein product [Dovyalis caffra]
MIDVISTNEWLSLALLAMEVSQMLIQGMWEYPNIDVMYEVLDGDTVRAGETVALLASLQRDLDGRLEEEVGPVHALRYSEAKEEDGGW